MRTSLILSYLITSSFQVTRAIELNVHDVVDSIKSAAKTVAYDLVSYYSGNDTNTTSTIGSLPSPYWWWESGAMWGALVDYWHYTGDTTYNSITHTAILSQLGSTHNFMQSTQVTSEGNDDQAFWGFAAMSAAEKNFTSPPSGTPSWLQIVTNLWNSQMVRWDTSTCGGGMRWQIYSENAGYDYKNSVTNGAFFQFSARLAHFTGNGTYVEWAEKAWDWATGIGLIGENYEVFDGTNDLLNCSDFDHTQWSYSHGIYLYGAAVMYNYTNGSTIWESRTSLLLSSISTFFTSLNNSTDIMFEPSCEPAWSCNTDQLSFKAYLSRFLWSTAKIAPFTTDAIRVLLQTSAQAAAASCIGGTDGTKCGGKWYIDGGDGSEGAGQQMSALELIQGLLINETGPVVHQPNVYLSAVREVNTTTQAPVPSATILTLWSAASSTAMSENSAERSRQFGLGWLVSVGLLLAFFI